MRLVLTVLTVIITSFMAIFGVTYKHNLNEIIDIIPMDIRSLNKILLWMGMVYTMCLIIFGFFIYLDIKKKTNYRNGYGPVPGNDKESHQKYVIICVSFLLVILITLICAAIYSSKHYDEAFVRTSLSTIFKQYQKDNGSKKIVNSIQKNFKCCGINGLKYWGAEIPPSCDEFGDASHYFESSCESKMFSYLNQIKKISVIFLWSLTVTLSLLGCSYAGLLFNCNKCHSKNG